MADLLWMPAVLRAAGLAVREVGGWQTRGSTALAQILGVMAHHTAGAPTGNYPSERVVVNGRPGLPGPLANLGLARDGGWIVIASRQANHAGTGSVSWCPPNRGNAHTIGVEAESVGSRDDWTAAQRASYPRGCAALLRHLGLPSSRLIGHKEWAPTRKIDPAFWDMNDFRAEVARRITELEGTVMANLSDADAALLVEAARSVLFGKAGVRPPGETALVLDEIRRGVAALVQRPATPVDITAIVDAIAREGLAAAVADELARRLSASNG